MWLKFKCIINGAEHVVFFNLFFFLEQEDLCEFSIETPNWFMSWTITRPVLALTLFNSNADLACALNASLYLFIEAFFLLYKTQCILYIVHKDVDYIQCFYPGYRNKTACRIPGGTMTSLTYLLLSPFSARRCSGCFFSLRRSQCYSILARRVLSAEGIGGAIGLGVDFSSQPLTWLFTTMARQGDNW